MMAMSLDQGDGTDYLCDDCLLEGEEMVWDEDYWNNFDDDCEFDWNWEKVDRFIASLGDINGDRVNNSTNV